MQLRRQTTGQRIELTPELEIGAGGQARVYVVPGDPGMVAKIFREPRLEYARKLAVMLARPPSDPSAAQGHASIAWPVDLLLSQDRKPVVVGYVMPRALAASPILERYSPSLRRRECPLFNYLYLYRVARNLASVFHALHLRDYVIGDVNESNILVMDTALVTLVDTDSFQVRDREQNALFRCPVGRPEFTPPELQGKAFHNVTRLPEHDRFGLAVMIFQLLMEGTHPFAGIYKGNGDPPPYEARIADGYFPYGVAGVAYRPLPLAPPIEILPPHLWQLFSQCFEEGHSIPSARPDAQTWVLALRDAEQNLAICAVNDQHRYGSHLTACPWCARKTLLGGRDPFPSQQSVLGVENTALQTTVQTSLPAAGSGNKQEEKTGSDHRKTETGGRKTEGSRQTARTAQPVVVPGSYVASPLQAERSQAASTPVSVPAHTVYRPTSPSSQHAWTIPVGLIVFALVAGGAFVITRPHKTPSPVDTHPAKSAMTSSNSGTSGHLSADQPTPTADQLRTLIAAINKGDNARVQTLLAQSPLLSRQTGKGKWTPLHYAAYKGNTRIAQELLNVGAEVNATEKDGYTALHLAAQEGKTEAARTLLLSHADINVHEKLGWTPLHFAAQEGHTEIVKLLLENGADISSQENKGLTPLAVAVKAKQTEVADLLRLHGAVLQP